MFLPTVQLTPKWSFFADKLYKWVSNSAVYVVIIFGIVVKIFILYQSRYWRALFRLKVCTALEFEWSIKTAQSEWVGNSWAISSKRYNSGPLTSCLKPSLFSSLSSERGGEKYLTSLWGNGAIFTLQLNDSVCAYSPLTRIPPDNASFWGIFQKENMGRVWHCNCELLFKYIL